MRKNHSLEKITRKHIAEVIGIRDFRTTLMYAVPVFTFVTGVYFGSLAHHDSKKEKELRKIVNDAIALDMPEPTLGYMQPFKAEEMEYDNKLLEYYKDKIIECNPDFEKDFIVRKAPDLNKDGKVGY